MRAVDLSLLSLTGPVRHDATFPSLRSLTRAYFAADALFPPQLIKRRSFATQEAAKDPASLPAPVTPLPKQITLPSSRIKATASAAPETAAPARQGAFSVAKTNQAKTGGPVVEVTDAHTRHGTFARLLHAAAFAADQGGGDGNGGTSASAEAGEEYNREAVAAALRQLRDWRKEQGKKPPSGATGQPAWFFFVCFAGGVSYQP
jgi:hypothetical protein